MRRVALAGLLATTCPPALAQWQVTPAVTVGVTHTDNVALAPSNEESESVTQLSPSVSASYRGRRATADVSYRLDAYAYAEDSDRNEAQHFLNADSSTNLVRERLFFDAGASVTEQIVDPQRTLSRSGVSQTGNTATVTTLNLSPYWRAEVGSFATSELRYERGAVRYSDQGDNDLQDADRDSIDYTLAGAGRERRLRWSLDLREDRVEFEGGQRDEFAEASVRLEFDLTRTVTLIGVSGEERNDIEGVDQAQTDGSFWEAGVRWAPRPGDVLEYRTGERFFGTTHALSWTHVGSRFGAEVSYSEQLQDVTRLTLEQSLTDNTGVLRIAPDAFVSRRLDAQFTWALARGSVGVNFGTEERELQRAGTTDTAEAVSLFGELRLGPRVTGNARIGTRRDEIEDAASDNRLDFVELDVTRQLGPRTTVVGSVGHAEADASDETASYTENTVSLRLTRQF